MSDSEGPVMPQCELATQSVPRTPVTVKSTWGPHLGVKRKSMLSVVGCDSKAGSTSKPLETWPKRSKAKGEANLW